MGSEGVNGATWDGELALGSHSEQRLVAVANAVRGAAALTGEQMK